MSAGDRTKGFLRRLLARRVGIIARNCFDAKQVRHDWIKDWLMSSTQYKTLSCRGVNVEGIGFFGVADKRAAVLRIYLFSSDNEVIIRLGVAFVASRLSCFL